MLLIAVWRIKLAQLAKSVRGRYVDTVDGIVCCILTSLHLAVNLTFPSHSAQLPSMLQCDQADSLLSDATL
jgi:hypothetical protein